MYIKVSVYKFIDATEAVPAVTIAKLAAILESFTGSVTGVSTQEEIPIE